MAEHCPTCVGRGISTEAERSGRAGACVGSGLMVCATHSPVRARLRSPRRGVQHLDLQQLPARSNTRPPPDETWIVGDRQQQCCTSVSVVDSCTGVPSYTRSHLFGQGLGDECMPNAILLGLFRYSARFIGHSHTLKEATHSVAVHGLRKLFSVAALPWPRVWEAEPHAYVFEGCARSGQPRGQWVHGGAGCNGADAQFCN
jgi:hypothetical protein